MKLRTLMALIAVAGLHGPLSAEDQPTLDDLLDLPTQKPAQKPEQSPKEGEGKSEQPLERSVQKRLTAQEAADLFRQVVRDMDEVAHLLGEERNAGLPTQRKQEEILAKLDQVIAAARQQQQQSGSGSQSQQQARQQDRAGDPAAQQQNQNQQGANQAGDQATSGENPDNFSPGNVRGVQNDERAMNENRVEWGNLPPRLRDELQQGFGERFSPIYRDLTEAYYRRLAEEGK